MLTSIVETDLGDRQLETAAAILLVARAAGVLLGLQRQVRVEKAAEVVVG